MARNSFAYIFMHDLGSPKKTEILEPTTRVSLYHHYPLALAYVLEEIDDAESDQHKILYGYASPELWWGLERVQRGDDLGLVYPPWDRISAGYDTKWGGNTFLKVRGVPIFMRVGEMGGDHLRLILLNGERR